MAARFLVSYPCQDACCEVITDQVVEGAPVYRCPGCDSEWIELSERKRASEPGLSAEGSVGPQVVDQALTPRLPGGE